MADPPRLRSNTGSLEALLLRSARSCEPPAFAEEEVWRRVQAMTAAGATVAAAGLAAKTASVTSKVAARALVPAAMKWGVLIAAGLPVAGAAAHFALHRELSAPRPALTTATAPRALEIADNPPPPSASLGTARATTPTVVVATAPKPAPAWQPVRRASSSVDASSALREESLALTAARAKFAAGDPRGALDAVARLGAEFPHGRLFQEREVLAMDCLTALGEDDGARARGRTFLDRFPVSPYVAHVRQIVER